MGVYQTEGSWAPSRKQGGADRGAKGALRGGGDDALLVILLAFDIVQVALYAALHGKGISLGLATVLHPSSCKS